MDEQEKIERRAHLRVIFTEILMSISVLALVGFLTLVVMGYSFNLREIGGTGEVVERSGLVQVSSLPTGATIYIDGEAPLLLSTNASRAMLAGEHEIALKREGFDEWKKTITVTEGLMYRLNYPRLFKDEREVERVFEFQTRATDVATVPTKYTMEEAILSAEGAKSISVSPNHEKMIMVIGANLYLMNLNENKPELRLLEIPGIDGIVVKITTISGLEWSGNSERVLAKVNGEWGVLNVRNAKETVWLKEIPNMDVASLQDVKFESEAGERLLVLEEEELREVNVRDKKLSEALLTGVLGFDNDGERIVFMNKKNQLMAYRVGDEEAHLISAMDAGAKFATERYFQESYVGVVSEGKFLLYRKIGWVTADEDMEKVFEEEIPFEISSVKKRGKGMVFELRGTGGENEVFDIEAMALTKVNAANTGWIDEYLRYRLEDGKLSVLDYDGLNERALVAEGVLTARVVTISGNNRWLYYFAKTDVGEVLVREKIN